MTFSFIFRNETENLEPEKEEKLDNSADFNIDEMVERQEANDAKEANVKLESSLNNTVNGLEMNDEWSQIII